MNNSNKKYFIDFVCSVKPPPLIGAPALHAETGRCNKEFYPSLQQRRLGTTRPLARVLSNARLGSTHLTQ